MEKAQGGNGVLLGGVPGVPAAEVVIIGGGVVGYNAARVAVGMGARVIVLDRSLARLNWLDSMFDNRLTTLYSTVDAVENRSEEHTSELQSLMRISYAVFCLKKKKQKTQASDKQKLLR